MAFSKFVDKAFQHLPTITVLAILSGFFLLYALGLVSILVGGIHLALGAVGYLLVLLIFRSDIHPSDIVSEPDVDNRSVSTLLLALFLLIFAVATVLVYVNSIRPLSYFALAILLYLVIAIQILVPTKQTWRDSVILGQTVLVHLHLAFSLSLKYHYYFGKTDTMPHAVNSLNVIEAGSISGVTGIYSGFPLWHTLTASSHLTWQPSLPIWKTMFLIGGCTGIVAILGSYAMASRLTGRNNVPFLTALLVSASPTVLFYSAYSIPRSAIVAFLPLIFLALIRFREARFVYTLSLLITSTILFHPATPPFLVLLFVAAVILSYAIETGVKGRSRTYARFTLIMLLLAVGYWIYQSPRLVSALGTLVLTSPGGGGVVQLGSTETTLSQLFDRFYYAPVLAAVLVGTNWLVNNRDRIPDSQFLFGGLGFAFFFVAAPGPLDLIAALVQNFSFSRWRTYVFPVILFTAAIGLVRVLETDRRIATSLGIVIVLVLLAPALLGYPVAPDNPAVDTDRSRSYFTESETLALDRMLAFNNQAVATDFQHRKLLQADPRGQRLYTLQYEPDTGKILLNSGQVGLYRYSEAANRSLLLQTPDRADVTVTGENLNRPTQNYNHIYDSGRVRAVR